MNREEILYCWIDEDGNQMSPTHRNFGAALSFVSDWQEKWDRLAQRQAELDGSRDTMTDIYYERESERIDKHRIKLSSTGKPPAQLQRIVVRTTMEEPAGEEREFAERELAKVNSCHS